MRKLSNSNSFAEEKVVRTFPLVFRLGLAVPETLVSGI